MDEQKKEMTLEESFSALTEITGKMENPDLSLEERFELYRTGMELIRVCTGKIDLVEKKLVTIREEAGAGA